MFTNLRILLRGKYRLTKSLGTSIRTQVVKENDLILFFYYPRGEWTGTHYNRLIR